MLNFRHEIPCPDDRAMRKFLWFAFFHDGDIQRIDFGLPTSGDVTLTVDSPLDIDRCWAQLSGAPEERRAQLDLLMPRFTYLLRFHGVRHFRHVTDEEPFWRADEILTLRFRDTPLLRRLQQECGQKLYHLRMETCRGMIDVVFRRFTIRRQEGRVDYRCDWDASIDEWDYIMQDVLHNADASPDADDYGRDCADCARLYHLHMGGEPTGLLQHARELLVKPASARLDAPFYAAFLLGRFGDETDLPALSSLYQTPGLRVLQRQTVLDAIDCILERRTALD